MVSNLEKHLGLLLELAKQNGYDLYLVGGTLRDHALGRDCSDFDFCARNAPEIARLFAASGKLPLVVLDDTPGRETTRVILQKQFNFDFTEMQGKTIEEDLSQRDFTFNAMALPLKSFMEESERYIDPHQGFADLQNRIVRKVPGPVFTADPLRMLRAFRFSATLGFDLGPETLEHIFRENEKISTSATERIYHEWILILSSGAAVATIIGMDRIGFLECVFPEIQPLRQSEPDAWVAGLRICRRLETILEQPDNIFQSGNDRLFDSLTEKNKGLLKFAALVRRLDHDPKQKSPPGGKSYEDRPKTEALLKRLHASNADTAFLIRSLRFHQQALESGLDFVVASPDESRMYRFVKAGGEELVPALLLAWSVKACILGEAKAKHFFHSVTKLGEFFTRRYLPALEKEALIDGTILKEKFKLDPSPVFRTILEQVEEARVLGKITTRDEAEELARHIINSQ